MNYGQNRKHYSIGDAEEIILQATPKNLVFTRHSFRRETKRNINETYIKKAILELDYLDITRDDRNNEFKLYYPSETHDNKELIIVIAIDDNENVINVVIKEKREWDIMSKIYFVFMVIFVSLVFYIVIYRYVNKDKIIENVKNNQNNVVVENTIE